MKIIEEIKIAHTELRCDYTKRFIKKNKPYKWVWVEPYGKSFVFKKRISKRKISKYILWEFRGIK